MRLSHITPRFVDGIPKVLEEGVLYISDQYGTASHNCACGCGLRVVTPLTPTDWKVIREKDGSVSVFPSIGNSDYPCESHYWIRRNKIEWTPQLSRAEIEAGREFDRAQRAAYFADVGASDRNWLRKIIDWIKRRFN
jgi:hypothetical protein